MLNNFVEPDDVVDGETWKDSNFWKYGNPTLPDDLITKSIAVESQPFENWLEFEIGLDAKEEWNELEMKYYAMIEMTLDGMTPKEKKETNQTY